MTERLRFYTDENVDPAIARGLRLRGIDAIAAKEDKRTGLGDPQQMELAIREGRVLVTHDEDFLVLASEGVPHAGIVYVKVNTRTVAQMVRFLRLLHDVSTPAEMRGRVEFA